MGPARSQLVLGHGAGGGVDAPDLLAVRDSALAASVEVARFELVTQPHRVKAAGLRFRPDSSTVVAWLARRGWAGPG